jgi:hypothetical protein
MVEKRGAGHSPHRIEDAPGAGSCTKLWVRRKSGASEVFIGIVEEALCLAEILWTHKGARAKPLPHENDIIATVKVSL